MRGAAGWSEPRWSPPQTLPLESLTGHLWENRQLFCLQEFKWNRKQMGFMAPLS